MSGNIQNKLSKIRKPRVHITLNVDGDGKPQKELPFVLGVMGDFSGTHGREKKPLGERSFVKIDGREKIKDIMTRIGPGLTFRVDDKLTNSDSQIPVSLKFSSLEDFDPARIAAQVPALRALMEERDRLRDLLANADRSVKLEGLLEQLLRDKNKMDDVRRDLGPAPKAAEAPGPKATQE